MSGNDYPLVSLQSIAKITTGNTPKTSNTHYYDADDISFFKPSDLCAGSVQCLYRSDSHLSESARPVSRIVPKNSILCTCIGIVGKVGILSHEAAFNQQINAATVDESIAVPGYIAHAIQFQASALQKKANAAVVPIINKKAFSSILVPLPDIETQAKLYGNLSSIQAEIERYKSVGERLEQLVKSRFVEMFGDPLGRPNYETKPLGTLFQTSSGGTPSKKISEYWDGGTIPWIGSNMCQDSIITETDGRFITEEGLSHSSAKLLRPDTVLVALVGATIGKTALLKCETTTNQNIAAIDVVANESFIPEYVFYSIQHLYPEFIRLGGGDFKMASQSFVRTLPIMVVPLEMQQEFATFVQQVDKSRFAVKRAIEQLELLKASLMQEYFG